MNEQTPLNELTDSEPEITLVTASVASRDCTPEVCGPECPPTAGCTPNLCPPDLGCQPKP